MVDWANNWQGKVREYGGSTFHLHIGRQYTSMLRSEVGLRLHQSIHYSWGDLSFVEKGSYANKKPFHTGSATAYFVKSYSDFTLEVFSGKVQNLGGHSMVSHLASSLS